MRFLIFVLVGWITGTFAATAQGIVFEKISNDRLLVPVPVNEEIEVVDGDTLWMGIHQIRLYGIDAFEPKQECVREGRPRTYCHLSASELLRTYTRRDDFRCEVHVRDGEKRPWVRYGRYVASCYAGDIDVSAELLRQGWAYADPKYGKELKAYEEEAAAAGRGVHATEHIPPWEWRRLQREPADSECACD